MYRTIWTYYFLTGLLSLTAGVPVMDDWASALMPVSGDIACRLFEPGAALSRADMSLCTAAGFNELRGLAGAGFAVLFGARADMAAADWVHFADVLVIFVGTVAAAIAVICIWANGMTRLAALSLTGTYTLVRAIGMALAPRRA